ncbi:MAG: preprotein translocase subunit YajC [Firmicutes bacterium]|nr:preprotein translocase subunit YajC [Bacillota bacterium]
MNLLLAAASDATGTSQNNGGSMWISLIMLAGMLVIFYFFIIRPQKKQEKQINDMRNGLQVGDEITTIGGIIGKVISIKEETVMIETGADKTKLRILRSAIKNIDVKAEDAQ